MLRVVEDHLGSAQVSRVIYGSIIGLALVVALEHDPPRPGVMVASLLATALAVALAEFYIVFLLQGNSSAAPMDADHLIPQWTGIASLVLIVNNFLAYSRAVRLASARKPGGVHGRPGMRAPRRVPGVSARLRRP